jgi:hypothetical protein
LSRAIRRTNSPISAAVLGRPGASALTPVIFSRDQLTVPSEQSIRCHQGLYLQEPSSADLLGLYREPSTLLIGEAESLPTQLLPQGSVTRKLRFLLLEIFDHVLLVSIDPASEDRHQKLERQSVHQCEFGPATTEQIGRNRRFDDRLSIRNRTCFSSADFWHTTGKSWELASELRYPSRFVQLARVGKGPRVD